MKRQQTEPGCMFPEACITRAFFPKVLRFAIQEFERESEYASSSKNFASTNFASRILRALLNWMGPFDTPTSRHFSQKIPRIIAWKLKLEWEHLFRTFLTWFRRKNALGGLETRTKEEVGPRCIHVWITSRFLTCNPVVFPRATLASWVATTWRQQLGRLNMF